MKDFAITLCLGWLGVHRFMQKNTEPVYCGYVRLGCLALVGLQILL